MEHVDIKSQLLTHVSTLTGIAENELPHSQSLLESGVDSIGLMRTVNLLRKNGIECSFELLKSQPTLNQWLELFNNNERLATKPAFPDIRLDHPSPLTPVQQAYWLGRRGEQPLGGVSCQLYLELQGEQVEPNRLQTALSALVARHPMLRARFTAKGEQYISEDPACLHVHDWQKLADKEAQRRLQQLRQNYSHLCADVEQAAPLTLQLSLLPRGMTRLHLNLDLLVADVLSISLVLRDLALFYQGKGNTLPALVLNFFQYQQLVSQQSAGTREKARDYWQRRLASLPAGPQLPLKRQPDRLTRPRFTRRDYLLKNSQLERLKQRAQQHGVTLATLFLTLYCEVLARWSETAHFLINIPLFNRRDIDPSVPEMVADFTTLLLLEANMQTPMPFEQRLRMIQQQLHNDIESADYSGVDVLRDMARLDGNSRRTAPVVFACNLGTPFIPEEAEQQFGSLHWMISQTPQVWIDHQSYPTREGLILNWDSVDDLFPPGMVDAMFNTWNEMLLRLVEQSWEQPLMLPLPVEMRAVREHVNATTVSRAPALLHSGFFRQAAVAPQAVALIAGEQQLSYQDLAQRALQVAGLLIQAGIKPQQVVAINLPKGIDQIAAVLGVLAAGAVWLPLAVQHPDARRAAICQQAAVAAVIGQEHEVWPGKIPQLLVQHAWSVSPLTAPLNTHPQQLAYIIYTSGSTGTPKGVAVCHQAAWNTIDALNQRFAIGAQDRVLALSGLEFDLSVYDVFGLLAAGGALVIPCEEQRRDPQAWIALAQYGQVTLWNSVPALLEMLLATETTEPLLPQLRLAWVSGDRVAPDLAARLRQRLPQPIEVIAMGGATEAAIWSNAFAIGEAFDQRSIVPYGYPLENQCFRVMDEQQRDCPDWVPGELWIGGAGLAQEYYRAPHLTEQYFTHLDGQRWYRTGDRGYYQPDGLLQFIGRQDHQVKIDGHRIELTEIEAALLRLPGVSAALCRVSERQQVRRLEAVVTGNKVLTTAALLEQLAANLPNYMLPQRLLLIDTFPLTHNGKVDRQAIGAWMDRQPLEVAEAVSADSALIARLRGFWQEILGQPSISPQQSFFQLGGNSLLAVRLVNRINQEMGIQTTLRHFLQNATLAAQALFLEETHPHLTMDEEGTL